MRSPVTRVRFLDGPNLFYPRPAGVLTVSLKGLGGGRIRARAQVRRTVRELTLAAGKRRVALRVRPGKTDDEIFVAVPWVSSGPVEALAAALDECLESLRQQDDHYAECVAAGGAAIAAAAPGRHPAPLTPAIPVVAITGTNGKTTTARVLACITRTAGLRTGLTSTHGVYVDDTLIDAGDYSGPGGAKLALSQPGLDVLIAETARGGILRRGIAFASVDVGVVTNVSPDHLGHDGVATLDQLAEVKATVARLPRPDGWTVLNADDPRVFAMRSVTTAKVWAFSADSDSPNVRAVVDLGGRACVVSNGWIALVEKGKLPSRFVALRDLAWTMFGANRANVENALAAASAALALGLTPGQVAAGLRGFRLDLASSRRFNVFSYAGRTVVFDMAHNEAGVRALLQASKAFQGDGRLLCAVGAPGNRGPEVHARLGQLAALGADVVAIVHVPGYAGGYSFSDIGAWMREGMASAGKTPIGEFDTTDAAVDALFARSQPGDVLALTAHENWEGAVDALLAKGATWDTPDDLRRKLI